MTVSFAKRVNQNQLRMYYRQRLFPLLNDIEAARRVIPERPLLEFPHQTWHLIRGRKHEVTLGKIHAAIFSRPRVNCTKPSSVDVGDI